MTKKTFHLLFEQSGTFKKIINNWPNISGGISALDYDIVNEYGETDKVVDLFDQIDRAFLDLPSIFDKMKPETDMILAFFPCTRFEAQCNMMMLGNQYQLQQWGDEKKLKYNLYLHDQLSRNYQTVTKLAIVCMNRGLKMIMENPYSGSHYLTRNWSLKPKVIDNNRRDDGDWYKKPTQYWFVNCEPKNNELNEPIEPVEQRSVEDFRNNLKARSEIHPQYAERFIKRHIADYVDGKYLL